MGEYRNLEDGRVLGAEPGSALDTRLSTDVRWRSVEDRDEAALGAATDAELEDLLRDLLETKGRLVELEGEVRERDDRIAELLRRADAAPLLERIGELEKDLQDEKDLSEQLQSDLDTATAGLGQTPVPPVVAGESGEDLNRLGREALDGIAAGLGLDPAEYSSKAKVIEAIQTARAGVTSNG